MFDYSLLHWTSFFIAAALLNLAPGPDIAYILGHSVSGGKKAGFSAMFGIWTGAFGHVMMAAAGLSAIIAASAVTFSILKWLGAGYLIWLGIQAWRSRGSTTSLEKLNAEQSHMKIYTQGTVVALLNPKVAIFFLAFLPQFVVEGAGPVWAQLVLHGMLIIVVAGFVEPPLIIIADKISAKFRQSPQIERWIDRTLGTLLIGLGLRLIVQER